MEVIALIVPVLGLIPIYFLIRAKLRKRYKFDLDYENITFASFSDLQNPKLDKRLCLIIYVLRIVNSSDESNTLKNVILSYRFDGKVYQDESYVVLTGMIPKAGKPAIILSNGLDTVFLMDWHNIRPKLGECEILQPGSVFSGSAVFLFESHVKDMRCIKNLKLIVTDFHGNKSSHPIAIKEDWINSLNKGFEVINKSFTITKDDAIRWN